MQAKLEAQRSGHKSQSHAANPSQLSGKLFDETGRRLIPSHARKGNKRYRYYVTPADSPCDPLRLPAHEIEQLVIKAVMNWAFDPKQVVDAMGWSNAKAAEEVIAAGQKVAQALAKSDQEQTPGALHRLGGSRLQCSPGHSRPGRLCHGQGRNWSRDSTV
ncbi:zinc ribbon domain-containing protein [Hydrogenophaga sp. A37]|uniref:zinc ribbon domain-containing protein n=1 Tax=Hydrogenophaga sp. A37 TaxID=1945864 RepID=UPI00117A540D|nr:zinc ribbon domain-containing protein [Hydrogenophaga sp. A37]